MREIFVDERAWEVGPVCELSEGRRGGRRGEEWGGEEKRREEGVERRGEESRREEKREVREVLASCCGVATKLWLVAGDRRRS